MGQIVSVKCPKCGYSATLNVGMGIRFNEIEYVVALFDEESKVKIIEALKVNENATWSVRNDLAECRHCKKITTIAVFTLKKSDGTEIVIKSKCACGKEARIVEVERIIDGKDELLCPLCGEDLNVEIRGMWD